MNLDAGDFTEWLTAIRQSMRDGTTMNVPCGACTACCRSAQFVDIGPDEADALTHIPVELLSPAPGRPGHRVLGYDAEGRCPMLGEDDAGCTIYEHRPRACRTFDCRIFAAAGIEPDEPGKRPLAEQVSRWRFTSGVQRETHARRDESITSTEAALRAVAGLVIT